MKGDRGQDWTGGPPVMVQARPNLAQDARRGRIVLTTKLRRAVLVIGWSLIMVVAAMIAAPMS